MTTASGTEKEKSKATEAIVWTPLGQFTMKTIGCTPKEAIKQGKAVFMARIYGEASAVKTKEAKNGDLYSYFVGEFRAINATGAKFESTKLFLPGSIFEIIEAELKAGDGKPVQFGYDVFSSPAENTIGYQYVSKPIVKTAASDRLSMMEKAINDKAMPKI